MDFGLKSVFCYENFYWFVIDNIWYSVYINSWIFWFLKIVVFEKIKC